MITIIIPTINDPYLKRTVDEVRKTADGPVEFIIINDGGKLIEPIDNVIVISHSQTLGRRVSINKAARMAQGDSLLILDPHCSMSAHWDTRMVTSCKDNNLVFAVIRDMDPVTWKNKQGDYLHVSMNREYTEKWWPKKSLKECAVEEESMCFTGCGWMIKKERYWQLGGYDESLGKYGWDGPEWACKIWICDNPGKIILRTDVICGHIFGTNLRSKLYRPEMIPRTQYVKYMQNKWGARINELVRRFEPVPDWKPGLKGSEMSQGTEREVILQRTKESVTRNAQGKIIKKVIEHYEYVHVDDGNGPSEKELIEMHGEKLKKVSEEVWELKDGKLQKVA